MNGRRAAWIVVLMVCCAVTAAPAAETANVVRFGALWSHPTGDLTSDGFFVEDLGDGTRLEFSGTLTVEADDALGFAFGYERRLTDLIGLDFNLFQANHDVDGTLSGIARIIDNTTGAILDETPLELTETVGDVDVTPVLVGANFHVSRGRSFDLYLGPFLGYVLYGDLEIEGEKVSIDDDLAFGAVLGVDVPFRGDRWTFCAALRYLNTKAEPKDMAPEDSPLDVKPWIAQVGFGRRF